MLADANLELPQEIKHLINAIENNELTLPTLPENAIKLQTMLDDMNVSITQIVSAISADPVFATQLMMKANSAFYSGKPKVDNLQAAVSRLGYKTLRNLVINISMKKFSNADNLVIRKLLSGFMQHSQETAAVSYVLVQSQKHLNADEATLAGLVHDIGVLPICLYLDKNINTIDEQACNQIICKYSGLVGSRLLKLWQFPEDISDIPSDHEDLQHETGKPLATYSDIVTVANLISQASAKFIAWENVTAIKKLGITAELCREFYDRLAGDIQRARSLLFAS